MVIGSRSMIRDNALLWGRVRIRNLLANSAAALIFAFVTLVGVGSAQADVNIVALGDSGIRGHGVSAGEAYPAQLEAALNARGHRVTVTNQGVDGDTTAGVLARLDSAVPDGADIVVFDVGANDKVLHHLSQEYVDSQIQEITRRLRARGIEVYRVRRMQEGMVDRLDLHVETVRNPENTMWHLNAAGYAIVVQRTLPAIEALVKKVEKRKH